MRVIQKAFQIPAYYASFPLFAALSFGLNCFCLLFGWLPGLAGRERFFQRLVHWDFAIFVWWISLVRVARVRYEGFARWPERSGLVVVANHPGLMDAGWLFARVREAMCIYKPAVGHNPLFGATARCAGFLANDRGYHLLRTAAAKVAAGHTLLVFPEGTRTLSGDLNPLKSGFVVMARVARAPIQLVHIACDSALMTKTGKWWRVPRLPATVTLTLGPCLPPPGDDTAAVVAAIESWFRASSAASRPSCAPQEPSRFPART
jgi:1-acyl-sn-glycerol-3-phosphate acyltransferase